MKMTEKQALALGKKVLKDIKFEYYSDIPLCARNDDEEKMYSLPELKHCWTVSWDWFDPDFLDGMDDMAFLKINDDTGEPVIFMRRIGGMGNDVIGKMKKEIILSRADIDLAAFGRFLFCMPKEVRRYQRVWGHRISDQKT